ncbi:hypothetical protein DTL70_31080 [Streptomyces diacarni]|uniref:Serine/arginine repetitive matrix protein 2 n=1 Tax=Streptomyces diacarni TaxID=2800381 RepID=A0A367E9L0_9ACTN|nr:hypothetical protein [Streptomyces diacarni]RCG14355.1 hypothetical protein DTL70_31080 [Streptomyces diacarni]
MTTPPLSGQPYPPHRPGTAPPPRPPAPSRVRRGLRAALTVAVVLTLACGGGTVWWLLRGRDDAPLADRPRVSDDRAGVSYALPPGWELDRREEAGPRGAFSSRITRTTTGGRSGGTVLTGRSGQVVPDADLGTYTEAAARSNAERFFPRRPAELGGSRATEVSGHPGHTVALRLPARGGRPAGHLLMTVFTVDSDRTSFVLGIARGGSRADVHDVEDVLAGARTR